MSDTVFVRVPAEEKIYKEESKNFLSPLWLLFFQKVAIVCGGNFEYPVKATQYKLSALNTAPANASATGTLGEIRIDANYIYVCVATNTWKRAGIATW